MGKCKIKPIKGNYIMFCEAQRNVFCILETQNSLLSSCTACHLFS